jgi:ribosomal protein L24E
MTYIVYVNNPTNKAFVHSTDCIKYLARKRDRTPNGYWTEPFVNMENALNYAKSTGKKTIDTCSFCCKPIE